MTWWQVLLLIAGFFVASIFACLIALGAMHGWLKDQKELFGFTKGVQTEFEAINQKLDEKE